MVSASSTSSAPLNPHIIFGTWNVNGKACKEDLSSWLQVPPSIGINPDVYVLGFQEFDLAAESFVRIDEPRLQNWCQYIESALKPMGTYLQIARCQLVGMLVLIYATPEFTAQVTDIETAMVGCGYTGLMGNKGAVAIRLMVGGNGQPGTGRSLCFVNCHLNAHQHNVKRRQEDFESIIKRLSFFSSNPIEIPSPDDLSAVRTMMKNDDDVGVGSSSENGIVSSSSGDDIIGPEEPIQLTPEEVDGLRLLDHDAVFWIGDLNYRVDLSRTDILDAIEKKEWDTLLAQDQLMKEMKARRVFQGFRESPPHFLPTYKFDTGTDNYDSSPKQRLPAFCDRVLWRVSGDSVLSHQHPFNGRGKRPDLTIVPLLQEQERNFDSVNILKPLSESAVETIYYKSHIDLRVSDHKPVSALLKVRLGDIAYSAEALETSMKERKAKLASNLPISNTAKGGYLTTIVWNFSGKVVNKYGVYLAVVAALGVAYFLLY